jgi:hypothetical protein
MILQPHSTWAITDATKLQTYMDCPRAYFYEYVIGWRPQSANIHLEFGSAWHLAMEHLIINGYGNQSVVDAMAKFQEYYRRFFPELLDDVHHPKTPAMAFVGLMGYIKEYNGETFTPMYTEIAGSVSMTDTKRLHFRMDSILQTPDGIKSREHKTGSMLSRQWIDQWQLKMQTGVYNHVLYCLFPREQVWGVEINGAIFSKKEVKFQRVPARRTIQGMEVWYWNTLEWMEDLERDFDRLLTPDAEKDVVMKCFKQNTENCTKYFGCRYHDFCMAWSNPLQHLDEVPSNMKVEYWDPQDMEREAKHVFNLEGRI